MRPDLLLAVLLTLFSFVTVGHAETVRLSRTTVPLEANMTMDFRTDQRVSFVDQYTTRIHVESVETRPEFRAVRFQWRMFDAKRHAGYDESGWVTTTGLRDGTALNAWWGPREMTTRETHLWLSQTACRELEQTGQTRYILDRTKRADAPLLLKITGRRKFGVNIDGRERQVPAWTLRSSLGDHLIVLSDCANPLILEIDVPRLYRATLHTVRTGVTSQ